MDKVQKPSGSENKESGLKICDLPMQCILELRIMYVCKGWAKIHPALHCDLQNILCFSYEPHGKHILSP
jgi:hypothetical protein